MEPFVPEKLPPNLSKLNWNLIIKSVSDASAALAYYNGILKAIVNPSVFLTPLETKEAVLSSRIEGTVTTVDEVLKFEVDLKPENITKQNDIIEVLNYRKATRAAIEWLEKGLPFNLTMITAIQSELLQGVRGRDKHPGEIRKDMVWIGPKDSPIEQAAFIPPEPLGIRAYLDDLLQYINRDDQEILLQTAVMHAQFEIIHPFYDGNGRTGRILIPLFLWSKKRISSPSFYISEYFDENRDMYIENLRNITQTGNWEDWIIFFLQAISTEAKRNSEKASKVLQLYEDMQARIITITKSPHAVKVLNGLFISPVMRRPDFIRYAGLEPKSAHRILSKLKTEKILIPVQEHSGSSPEILLFDALYRLIQ